MTRRLVRVVVTLDSDFSGKSPADGSGSASADNASKLLELLAVGVENVTSDSVSSILLCSSFSVPFSFPIFRVLPISMFSTSLRIGITSSGTGSKSDSLLLLQDVKWLEKLKSEFLKKVY